MTGLELRDEVRVMTERLFDVPGVAPVRFPGSRLVLDPERFESDDEEIMATRGMGVIYTRTSQQTPLPGRVAASRARALARGIAHHAALTSAVRMAGRGPPRH